ncbi:4-hydroxyphenylpyruvate dioxygenase-like [Panonychus citri]|uniref:4-hydroxyphenylpyruvate dioxygenase-like n=1 Tax=Panonychus citri TaxID=50023 RepID=UPI002306F936|nr:4-hydroxyphenylpyruvate dioxygenase-like [Panonychus citri]XP_053202548.1 4-hydroxyphenylpyruvate dioxygenase-like [Panonychus citri]
MVVTQVNKITELSKQSGIISIDHVTFYVSNAKYAAAYFTRFFGFKLIGYKGLETGSRSMCSYVVSQGDVVLVLCSTYQYGSGDLWSIVSSRGDMVKDVAFTVDCLDNYLNKLVTNGVEIIRQPWTESDQHGSVRMAVISPFGDITHTLIERTRYSGTFLPSFHPPLESKNFDEPLDISPEYRVSFKVIDHFVPVLNAGQLEKAFDYYSKLGLETFYSVDDFKVKTDKSRLNMVIVANKSKDVIINLVAPSAEDKLSQLHEFLKYNNGSGIQHLALRTDNIVATVTGLRARGVQFLEIPSSYYDKLRQRLDSSKISIKESIDTLEKLQILCDFNENGYILQLFGKPLFDRPTSYLEIIQRNNHSGFGAGNVQALYEAVERLQKQRGNL